MLPPIRYPLPTLVLVLIAGVAAWRGEQLTRPLRAAIAAKWTRAVEGPPIPASTRPQVVAGPVIRRGLLLHDDVAVSTRPGGAAADSIRVRMFVDIYDVWPLEGAPNFYRVGNRNPIGWIKAADLLPWNTRLVVRAPAIGKTHTQAALPVLSWTDDSVEVAAWDEGEPWKGVQTRARIGLSTLRPEDWGVWLSREELLTLLRRLDAAPAEPAGATRVRALLGRAADSRPLSTEELASARAVLPASLKEIATPSVERGTENLARANESWQTEASWGGLSFQFVPLASFP